MGYNRHYYSHGAEPFAYQWHGRIQFPSRDASSLHGLGAADMDRATLLNAKLDESGTKTKVDPRFVPIVIEVQQMTNAIVGPGPTDGLIRNVLPRLVAIFGMSESAVAELRWYDIMNRLAARMPKTGGGAMPTKTKVLLGVGVLGLLYLVTRK